MAAAANATNGHSYTYMDQHPLAGPDYYRLAQVDLDGTTNYSPEREVTVPTGKDGFRMSPNPADGALFLELENPGSGSFDVRLMDLQGRTLRTWAFQKQGQYWSQSIDVGNLAAGSYFIQVTGSNFQSVRAFIKK